MTKTVHEQAIEFVERTTANLRKMNEDLMKNLPTGVSDGQYSMPSPMDQHFKQQVRRGEELLAMWEEITTCVKEHITNEQGERREG